MEDKDCLSPAPSSYILKIKNKQSKAREAKCDALGAVA